MTSRMVGSVLTLLSLLFSVEAAVAQTYTQMQWGMNKAPTPYGFGANINGTWRDLGTVSAAGVWSIPSTNISGLGTAATQNIGTSGANVPLLNGVNTWSGAQTFSGGATIPFMQSGTGAVPTTVDQKLKSLPVTPDEFGAVPGSGDDSAAIALADAAAASVNRYVYFPGGTYDVATGVNPSSGSTWDCGAYQRSIIRSTNAAADIIAATNGYFTIRNCQLQSSVTKTGGAYIHLYDGSNYEIYDVFANGAFRTLVTEKTMRLTVERFYSGNAVVSTGVDVEIKGCIQCIFQSVYIENNAAARPFAHMVITSSEDIHMTDVSLTQGTNNLYINPGSGKAVSSIKMIGGYLDECGSYCLSIVPTGTGSVNKILLDGTWMSMATGAIADAIIQPVDTSVVDFVQFIGAEFYGKGGIGYGLGATQVAGTTVTNIQIIGGVLGRTNYGLYFDGVTSFHVSNLFGGNYYSPGPITCLFATGTITYAAAFGNRFSTCGTALNTGGATFTNPLNTTGANY